uniref:Succinate dehydrogenase assembly factor 2, mitochondrial n=1 Tax=Entomoneis paludosa TaxID=265537 RepID=A0A7S2YT63_9STRA
MFQIVSSRTIAGVARLPSLSSIGSTSRTGALSLLRRGYRGEANESDPVLSAEEKALFASAKPKADAIFAKHVEMPKLDTIPDASLPYESDEIEIRRKRLVYRSKQRGWLEVDLLLGTWASENVPSLNAAELDEYEEFVNQETIDIYNIITLRVQVLPENLQNNQVVQRIQNWARGSPLGKADPEKYKQVKSDAQLI